MPKKSSSFASEVTGADMNAPVSPAIELGAGGHGLSFEGNVADVIENLRSGQIGAAIIPRLAGQLGLSVNRFARELRLPAEALTLIIASNGDLSPSERDRVYRVERVLARANSLLSSHAQARAWITSNNRSLGGVSPLSLLDTEAGYELVQDTLGRIEYGVIS